MTLRVANDYTAVIEGMKNRQIHVGFFGPPDPTRAPMQSRPAIPSLRHDPESGRLHRYYSSSM